MRPFRFLGRHRGLALAVIVALAATTALGALAQPRSAHYAHARGLSCVFHGWRAYSNARRQHPLWTAYHLWRAARTCHPAPWRY